MEDQAELVPGGHRRQDDSSTGPALHVPTRRFDDRRGCGQSRDLRLAAECGGGDHQEGRWSSEGGGELSVAIAHPAHGQRGGKVVSTRVASVWPDDGKTPL